MRLVDGSTQLEGHVQVYNDGIWGFVCDDNWDIYDARKYESQVIVVMVRGNGAL